MCHIPRGPRRGYGRTSNPIVPVIIDFWTGKCLCGVGQSGGCTKVNLGARQIAKMKNVIIEQGRDHVVFHEFTPDFCNKIIGICYKQLELDMITEAYNCSNFQGKEFKGWSKNQKIPYIRRNSEGDI